MNGKDERCGRDNAGSGSRDGRDSRAVWKAWMISCCLTSDDGRKGAYGMTETKIAAEVVIDPMVAVL